MVACCSRGSPWSTLFANDKSRMYLLLLILQILVEFIFEKMRGAPPGGVPYCTHKETSDNDRWCILMVEGGNGNELAFRVLNS